MKKYIKMTKSIVFQKFMKTFVMFLFACQFISAEGSKDLYPSGVKGNRAFLMSMACDNCAYNPFPTIGRHYVYAKAGEIIYLGSSVQGSGSGRIRAFSPNGAKYESSADAKGLITKRSEELAGPKIGTSINTAGYTPYSIVVGAEETGIWVVEFVSRGTSTVQTKMAVAADAEWSTVQTNVGDVSAFIAAWDITVASGAGNNSVLKTGRVYSTVFNGSIYADPQSGTNGFFGKFYALTKDGFVYLIDNNGQSGLSFNTFVNNRGTKYNSTLAGKSFAAGTTSYANALWDPRKLDNENVDITHKMFFNMPSEELPETASIYWGTSKLTTASNAELTSWSNTNKTKETVWLKPKKSLEKLDKISFVGVEGTVNTSSKKGGYFVFNSSVIGNAKIELPIGGDVITIQGPVSVGENKVHWNGKNSKGEYILQQNTAMTNIKVAVTGAEVHFPFLDVEYNLNGVIIDMQNGNATQMLNRDRVFWDVSGFAAYADLKTSQNNRNNSTVGKSSKATNETDKLVWYGGSQFGNDKGVVIWSYAEDTNLFEIGPQVVYRSSDLKVTNMQKTSGSNLIKGSSLSYVVEVANEGDLANENDFAATFMFYLPLGVSIDASKVVFSSTTGAQLFDTATIVDDASAKLTAYKVKVNMPANSTAKFEILVSIGKDFNTFPVDSSVPFNAWATIMRSRDTTDPNATNENVELMPSDPFLEANGIHQEFSKLNLNSNISTNTLLSNLRTSIDAPNPSNSNFTNNIRYVASVIDLTILSSTCVKPGMSGLPDSFAKVGVVTKASITNKTDNKSWPENVPNAHIVLDSASKGFVITHMTTAQRDALTPVKGMLIYNTTLGCVQLYRGTNPTIADTRLGWNCIEKSCND